MPKITEQPIDFNKNTDGMMPVFSNTLIAATGARQAINVNLFPLGGFSRRKGYARDNTTAQAAGICTGLYEAVFSDGTRTFVGTCDTKIGVRTLGAAAWTDKTGVLTITAGENKQWVFSILNDVIVGCNDTDTCIQINSALTTAVLAGAPAFTSALFCLEYRGYMFYGNTVETATRIPDRLRFSDNGAPNVFTATNFIGVHTKQGGTLRGGCVYLDRLLAFKENNIYEILYQPTRVASDGTAFPFIQNPNPVVNGVGTQSHRTIVRFTTPDTHSAPGEYIFFLDQNGMPRVMASNYKTMKVGYSISNCRDTTLTTLNSMVRTVTALRSTWTVDYPERNQIWLFMAATTQMDTCWVLDYTTGWAWSRHSFADSFTCGARAQDSAGIYRIFTGDRNGYTCRHDTTNLDNATNISMTYETGDVYKGSTSIRCNWPFFEVRGTTGSQSQSMQIGFIPDGNDIGQSTQTVILSTPQPLYGSVVWGQFNWARTGTVNRTINPALDAKTMRTKFQNVAGSDCLVESFSHSPKVEGTFYE